MKGRHMRWSMAISLGAALAVCLCGCRANHRRDAVEAELRARETDVNTLKGELDRELLANRLLSQELAALQGLPGPDGVVRAPSEPYPVQSLALGRRTAGRYDDRLGGDDALDVQVEPRDTEGQAIKAPGTVSVEVFEVSPEGTKAPLSTWTVSREELRTKWQGGLFSTGYLLTFPWKVPPVTDKLRVVVRFQMLNGRVFEADKDVTIRVLPGAREKRKSLPLPLPLPAPPEPMPPGPQPDKPGEKPAEKPTDKPKEAEPKKKELPPPMPAGEEGPPLTRAGDASQIRLLKPIPLPADVRSAVVSE
jgi:hypothetical protein